jgi:hypothetical protein
MLKAAWADEYVFKHVLSFIVRMSACRRVKQIRALNNDEACLTVGCIDVCVTYIRG